MSRSRLLLAFAVTCLTLAGGARPGVAQDSAVAAAPAPALDSARLYVGDWDWSGGTGDRAVEGVWRINYTNGRFTGIVARPGMPAAPIASFALRNGREFTLTVEFTGEMWTFTGRLENARSINGTLSRRGGIDRLRAQKRAG